MTCSSHNDQAPGGGSWGRDGWGGEEPQRGLWLGSLKCRGPAWTSLMSATLLPEEILPREDTATGVLTSMDKSMSCMGHYCQDFLTSGLYHACVSHHDLWDPVDLIPSAVSTWTGIHSLGVACQEPTFSPTSSKVRAGTGGI